MKSSEVGERRNHIFMGGGMWSGLDLSVQGGNGGQVLTYQFITLPARI